MIIEGLKRIIEQMKRSVRWRDLDIEEIKNELSSEPSFLLFVESITGKYYQTWVNAVDDAAELVKQAKTVKIKSRDIVRKIRDVYAKNMKSIGELRELVVHYGKDVNQIMGADSLPKPLLMRDKDGNLEAMGGRTRLSLAALSGVDVSCLVLDYNSLALKYFDRRLDRVVELTGYLLDEERYKEYARKYFLSMFKKGGKQPPKPKDMPDNLFEYVVEEAGYFYDKNKHLDVGDRRR